jgi:hypothetical protein
MKNTLRSIRSETVASAAGQVLVSGGLLAVAVISFANASASVANAATKSSGSSATSTAAINCVAKAVATREDAVDSAVSTYNASVMSAYDARAKSLASAYATGNATTIASAIKTVWATFDAASKNASAAYATKRLALWNTFKTASTACKAPPGVIDYK